MKFAKNFHQNGIISLRWMVGWKKFILTSQIHTTQNPCRGINTIKAPLGYDLVSVQSVYSDAKIAPCMGIWPNYDSNFFVFFLCSVGNECHLHLERL
jgi:hypothetical protein